MTPHPDCRSSMPCISAIRMDIDVASSCFLCISRIVVARTRCT
jgi:hypothetical protein